MVQKKIDNRIRTLIENGVVEGHRTMFVVVGENGRDQVMVLHQMLSKAAVKARPNVLWCYKKDLGFSSHRKKRMKNVQDKIKAGKVNLNEDDPFELFIGSTNIRYCYYSETQKILGNTYGMCVLQDFEALTPNLLARTIETVEGGGLIVLLLQGITSTRQLYTMAMDIHDRYRTEAHNDVVGRFNERFLLSLPSCSRCLVVDDQLTVLPLSSHVLDLKPVNQRDVQAHGAGLKALKENMSDTQLVGCLINCCKTLDQGKALLRFIEALTEKTLRATVSLTASRGRGKSAALGLAVAGSIAFGYSNIFVTSPSPENLKTFFEFVFKGLDALGYCEHMDYGLVQSTNPEHDKALIRVNVYRNTRQTIQYIHPSDANKLLQAELLVIDEAAAIPLPYVRDMLGPYLVFLASTINGYEGTGRSLSLKLLQQLREQTADRNSHIPATNMLGRTLCEVELEESIRYRPQDAVEKWLYEVLCLDATSIRPISSGTPPPNECFLYYVNRDTLFCYHKASETFLQRLVSLFVSSHYKNSPNDLQMMSDAPAHNIFVLLGPVNKEKHELPDVLCAIQTCFEGQLSRESVSDSMTRGKKAAGDLIPWTMAQQFQDEDFPSLCGVRIVRIATHPNYQGMGYGSRALKLLKDYFDMKMPYLDKSEERANYNDEINYGDILTEKIVPRETLPPLLQRLDERRPEDIDYIGTSFGLTLPLLKFWKRAGFIPVYVRQTSNELTGEHSCIMLRANPAKEGGAWLPQFWEDFCRRFTSLLSYRLRVFTADVALCIIQNQNMKKHCKDLSKWELDVHLTKYDIKRIELYCNNMVDYHLIMDLLPVIGTLLFCNKMGDICLSALQRAIMLGLGLQRKTVEQVSTELNLPPSQLLGIFNRMMRKVLQYLTSITEQAVEESLGITNLSSEPQQTTNTLPEMNEELENANKEMKSKQKKELKKLKKEFSDKFAIQGTNEDWDKALMSGVEKGSVTIKSKRKLPETNNGTTETPPKRDKKKKKKVKFI